MRYNIANNDRRELPDISVSPNNVPQGSSSAGQNQAKPIASSSPWDEELPEPELPKERVVGTLGAPQGSSQTGSGKPAPFVVPSNIDTNVGPKVVTPGNFPNAINAVPNQAQNPSPAAAEKPLFTYGTDFASSPPKTIPADEGVTALLTSPPASTPSVPAAPNPSAPLNPAAGGVINDIRPVNKTVVNPSSSQPNVQISPNNNPMPPEAQQSPGLIKRIWPFARQNNAPPEKPAAGIDGILNQSGSLTENDVSDEQSRPSGKLRIWAYFATGFAVLSLIVFLTELGVLSIGLEKVYGAVGLETFWGGLPAKSDKAIALSFLAMQEHPDFKIKGSLDMTVDKTKKSDLTTPLTLSYIPYYDRVAKAILAVADTSSDWSATDWAVDDGTSSSSSDTSSSATTDPTTPASSSSSATGTSSETDQQGYQPYQSIGASTKEVQTTFDGFIGQTGNEVSFVVNKAVGSDKINLKNLDDKLWTNSDNVVFGGNEDPAKWFEYTATSLSGKILSNEFLAGPANGLSVKGSRKANEKVSGVRCYKYEISEITLGSSLTVLGIKSDTVQSINGDVWIGIKDKLVHKIDIKITLAPSYSVTQLTLSAELYDYDVINNFTKVSSTEIYQPETAGVSAGGSSTPPVSVPQTGDAKRKSDLVLIQNALELYKDYYYSYPTAPTLVKLNTASNILEKLLVPGYLSILPADPKAAEGWYYGYKSDGTTYTLSARLEDASDPVAVLTNGVSLYFLNNQ